MLSKNAQGLLVTFITTLMEKGSKSKIKKIDDGSPFTNYDWFIHILKTIFNLFKIKINRIMKISIYYFHYVSWCCCLKGSQFIFHVFKPHPHLSIKYYHSCWVLVSGRSPQMDCYLSLRLAVLGLYQLNWALDRIPV